MREGWSTVSLGDIATTKLGKTLPRGSGADLNGEPYLRNVNVQWGRIDTSKLNRMPFTETERAELALRRDDILVCEGGEVGRLALVKDDLEGVFFQNALHRVRVDKARAIPAFVALSLEHFIRGGGLSGLITQVTIAHLNQKKLRDLPVNLPPLDEQRRIVDLIGSLDDAIEAARTSAANLQNVLRWYPDGVLRRAESASWEAAPLRAILGGDDAIRTGPFGSQLHKHDYVSDGPVGVIMPANMDNGRVDLESVARIGHEDAERLSRHLTQPGDIVWARRGDVTRFAVIDEESAGSLCGTGCFLLRPEDALDTPWLEVILSSQRIAEWLVDHAVGATMPNLNRAILGNIPVRVPPPEVRVPFAEAWSSLRSAEAELRHSADSLRDLRSNLLTVLLSGEHEIPESYDELVEEVAA